MSPIEYRNRLHNAIIDLLWQQWGALGVCGYAVGGRNDLVLDPEALLVFSSRMSRYDGRLYDLILDWLAENGDSVNLQRLKSIARKSQSCDLKSLAYMAAVLTDGGERKWAKLAELGKEQTREEGLLLSLDGDVGEFVPKLDALALNHGFRRNEYVRPGKAMRFPKTGAASLMLRMRTLAGLSARAEILVAFLDGSSRRIQELADKCGYTWKSTWEALSELERGGIVEAKPIGGRGAAYSAVVVEELRRFLGVQRFEWPDWVRVFDAVFEVWSLALNPRLAQVSPRTVASEFDRIADKIRIAAPFIPDIQLI